MQCTSILQTVACITAESRMPDDLVKLLCALQSSLFFWCHKHLMSKEDKVRKAAKDILLECTYVIYTIFVTLLSAYLFKFCKYEPSYDITNGAVML